MTNTAKTSRARLALAAAAVAALPATAGCAADDSGTADADRSRGAAEPAAAADGAALDETARQDALGDRPAEAADRDGAQAEVDGPKVIATATVSLESEDVARARFAVRKVVDEHRGSVTADETTAGDEGEVETARLVLRVPSAAFDDAKAELEEVGTLTGSTTTTEDVTAQVVDVEARIRSQRKSVARIEALLARAQDLSEIVSIESQLASRQADLESLLSRQEHLADQTSFSTITVHIEQADEPGEKKEDTEDAGFLSGLADGWDAFAGAVVVALTAIGFLLPWLGLLALVLVPVWALLRRRPRPTTTPAPPSPQP